MSLARSPSLTRSPSPTATRAPWNTRRGLQSIAGRNSPYSSGRSATFRDKLRSSAEKLQRRVISTVETMSILQRILAVLAVCISAALGVLFLIYNEKIFGWLEPIARKWKDTTGGWIILWLFIFATAFPPVIGYSTCSTLTGFVYGIPEGWLILASATVVGSFCSFLVSRGILRKYVERLVANDKRFAALSLTLKHDGLKLLCMIRLCPLPYSLSNGAMSMVPTVQPHMYAFATAMVTPKLLVHVFIGSRLAAIAKSGEKMSFGTLLVNWGSILIGAVVGLVTGWYIYQKTMARARQLEAEEVNDIRTSVTRTGTVPKEFSDDAEAQQAALTVAEGSDGLDFFDEEDPGHRTQGYQDDLSDEDDIFSQGDGHEDDAIALRRQGS